MAVTRQLIFSCGLDIHIDDVVQLLEMERLSLPVGHNIMNEAFDQLLEIALQFA